MSTFFDCWLTKLVNKVGPIDILINNAGIFKCTEFSETPIKDFEVLNKS